VADQHNKQTKSAAKKMVRDTFAEDDIFQTPEITRDPASRQAKLGSRMVLRVVAVGKPLPTFQWFHNGKKISGANSDRLSLHKVRRQAVGSYHCEVKNFVGKAVSRAAMLTFFTRKTPQLVIGPGNSRIEEGTPFTLSVTSPDPKELTDFKIYWMFNGMRIKGAHGPSLNISGAKKKYEGEYKAMIATGSSLETSNVVKLTVRAAKVNKNKTPSVEAATSLPEAEAEEPTTVLPEVAATHENWGDFNFNPEEDSAFVEGSADDHEKLVAPSSGAEQFGDTTYGAPHSLISELGTQDLIRELASEGAASDLLGGVPHEDPSNLISATEGPRENALFQEWGIAPVTKQNEPDFSTLADAFARTQISPPPLPRSKVTLARKKELLENMLRHWQGKSTSGKRAA
jgi:hypothetical protein